MISLKVLNYLGIQMRGLKTVTKLRDGKGGEPGLLPLTDGLNPRTSSSICGRQSGTGVVFLRLLCFSHVSIISPIDSYSFVHSRTTDAL